jgi:glycosyltransferase involved in cell wall biosynthesis
VKVSVLICTHNRAALLDRTLAGLAGLRVPDGVALEVVVVDNRSTDDTPAVIERHADRLPIVHVHEPELGLSYARNTAVARATGELLLWTDDDVMVSPDWLSAFVEAARRWPDAAFFGGPIAPDFEGTPPVWVLRNLAHLLRPYSLLELDQAYEPMRYGAGPIGANMAFRADVLKGYRFDATFGQAGTSWVAGDDVEFFARLFSDGFGGIWVGDAKVRHLVGKSRQSPRYIFRWYEAHGRMRARVFGVGRSSREALEVLRATFRGPNGSSWNGFFAGPWWLRMIKVSGFWWGFQRELSRMGGRAEVRGTDPRPALGTRPAGP